MFYARFLDARPLILLILILVPLTLLGLVVRARVVARYRPSEREQSLPVTLWIACDRYRRGVAEHVAWRLAGRPGDGPVIPSSFAFKGLDLALMLQSPGPIANAGGALVRQTALLGATFVRDSDDPWMPDPHEWEARLAEWQILSEDYKQLAHVDLPDSTGGADPTHRHLWSRTYTLRRSGARWVLEYAGDPLLTEVLSEGAFSASGNQFRECEDCGTWESWNGSRGQWGEDVYSRKVPSPRLQILTGPPDPEHVANGGGSG